LELFFTYRDDMPDGHGFAHFSAKHLLFLAGIVLFIILFTLLYRNAGKRTRKRLRAIIASCIVLMEVAKQLLVTFTVGDHIYYHWELLPLHLCGISIIMVAIHTVKQNRFTGEYLYSLSIPGAAMALIFADWTMYPLLNFYCLQSFLIHMLELTYPIMLLAAGELRPAVKNLWMPSLFLLVTVPLIYRLNHILDTNFFFMNEAAPDSPLSFLQTYLGSPGYIFGAIGILAILWFILYTPLVIYRKKKSRRRYRT